MINSKNFRGSMMAVAAIAVCGLTLGAATLLAPAAATPRVSAPSAVADDAGYLPAQIANRATEIEPMPEMYY